MTFICSDLQTLQLRRLRFDFSLMHQTRGNSIFTKQRLVFTFFLQFDIIARRILPDETRLSHQLHRNVLVESFGRLILRQF